MTRYCAAFCGTCPACLAAKADDAALDAVYATLSPEDAASISRRDEDDPRTFALDSKGRP